MPHYISPEGRFRIIWMGLCQCFVGFGCGDYGRFVVWLGPLYIAVR